MRVRQPRSGARTPVRRAAFGLACFAVVLTACGHTSGSIGAPSIPSARVVEGGTAHLHSATLEINSGFSSVTINAHDLGGFLFRADTPSPSPARPVVVRVGSTVEMTSRNVGNGGGPSVLAVTLATGVSWTIDLNGGASSESVNMQHGLLSAVKFTAGVSSSSVRLPMAVGTTSVDVTGGASSLSVVAPSGPPAQVTAGGGAGQVQLDGTTHNGVAGGSVFTEPSWSDSRNRYTVDLAAGVSSFTMTRA
jgi:hypothetical protein